METLVARSAGTSIKIRVKGEFAEEARTFFGSAGITDLTEEADEQGNILFTIRGLDPAGKLPFLNSVPKRFFAYRAVIK
jgi:hypothetical protein